MKRGVIDKTTIVIILGTIGAVVLLIVVYRIIRSSLL